jgi:hypothetical protein
LGQVTRRGCAKAPGGKSSLSGKFLIAQGKFYSIKVFVASRRDKTALEASWKGSRARRRVEVNRISVKGPALFGMAAVIITSIWIYLLFFVIPPVFNGTSAPGF